MTTLKENMLSQNLETEKDIIHRMITEIEDYAIILLSPGGRIVSWNSGASHIKGYSTQEILGQSFTRFYTAKDQKEGKPQQLLELARKENHANDEGWRVRKDGTRFWASVTITSIHDEDGNISGFSKVTRDLTEQKSAQENLKKLNRAISEIEDYAIIVLDIDGFVLNWNKGAQNIKGYDPEEIIGKNFRQFYTLEDLDSGKPAKLLQKAIKEGKAHDEGWRVSKGGSRFWAGVTITTIHDDDGQVKGFSKVTRDLTERKKAAEKLALHSKELKAKNEELNQFTYIASHDLQEPLNTVKSVIAIMRDNYEGKIDDTADELLGYITNATERMSELIRGLLDYGRIGMQSKSEEVNTTDLLKNVKADLNNRLTESGAKLKIGKLPKLNVHKTELRLLFQNLISNGIKFQKNDIRPEIDVSAKRQNGHWTFCVKDNGIGIPENYQSKLFKMFKRLPTDEEYEGTGIGLAHCKKVVDLHGGKIWVESEINKGSSFYFTIPLKK